MEERARERRPFVSKFLCHNTRAMGGDHSFLAGLRGRILTLPPEISPSPRQPSAGRGLGRGASTGLQTWAAVAFRQGGLLSPTLSSQGGGGGPGVGGWEGQDGPRSRRGGGQRKKRPGGTACLFCTGRKGL